MGTDLDDFNWVGDVKTITKGEIVWENVIDGEIVAEKDVAANEKFRLRTDTIFVHVDEAFCGGIIYFDKGKYSRLHKTKPAANSGVVQVGRRNKLNLCNSNQFLCRIRQVEF